MASRRVEDIHQKAVDRILLASGLVCIRSPPTTEEASTMSLETEEVAHTEEEIEHTPNSSQEEALPEQVTEESAEEEAAIFPSPSLRRVLTDKMRKIEEQNRIHVLPNEFKTKIDPDMIPKIAPHIRYHDIIAHLVGCTEYKSSLAEFWFLDTLANLVRRAQEDLLPRPTQAVLMLWFCEWMKEVQNFDAADRKRLLRRFKENMLSAARFITNEPRLPTPDDAGVYYKAADEAAEPPRVVVKPSQHAASQHAASQHAASQRAASQHVVTFQECAYECAMRDLVKIMHYIFDLFSTDYQFDLVRSIFTYTPEYHLIDMPYTMQNPKHLYVPLKPKKEKPKEKDAKKKVQKGKKEVETEEYIALMELKAKEERELEEQELKDAENWNMRRSILPLSFAATDELFDKYWPPPEPEAVPEIKPEKGKKPEKGGKKK